MPDRFSDEEVRNMQAYSDSLALSAMLLHEQIEEECGPVSVNTDDGILYPSYTVNSYMSMLAEAIDSQDIDEVEHVFTLILASMTAINGKAAPDMRQAILDDGFEITEE